MKNKEQLNRSILGLNSINYDEMILNHIMFGLENETSYKNLIIENSDYDSKILICSEIIELSLDNICNELINTFYGLPKNIRHIA